LVLTQITNLHANGGLNRVENETLGIYDRDNRPIQKNAIKKHVEILVKCFKGARILIHDQIKKLNQDHRSQVSKFLIRLRSNLTSI